MLLLFLPQSAGRIRAIYFFFLSAPFAILVYNPLVKYERGSSSTACALRQRYLLYCFNSSAARKYAAAFSRQSTSPLHCQSLIASYARLTNSSTLLIDTSLLFMVILLCFFCSLLVVLHHMLHDDAIYGNIAKAFTDFFFINCLPGAKHMGNVL